MGEKTNISWTDHTFNPWIGCTKVSAGCTHCYAERENKLFKWTNQWGNNGTRVKTSDSNWNKPLVWNRNAARDGVRHKVFCASLADVFENARELDDWRVELFDLIFDTPNLDWLLLTKRPENYELLTEQYCKFTQFPWSNVWMGVTAENQEMADKRIPILLDIPARLHFLSVEPMLGKVELGAYPIDPNNTELGTRPGVNWVICGGESGSNARPMNLDWAKDLQLQCSIANIPYFFKQVGGNKKIDGHWGGDLLDGIEYKEFPKWN